MPHSLVDVEAFRKSPAGRLVQAGPVGARYWAFCPAPLPPPISWDPDLVAALSTADRSLGELAGLARTLPNPRLLAGPLIRLEAVLSSRIEGTQANLSHLYAYQAGELQAPGLAPAVPESDVREVANYVEALEYGLSRSVSLPVSVRLMRELHERLMTGVRGGYATPGALRTSQNWIGPPNSTLNQAAFVPPPPGGMQEALSDLERYVQWNDPLPPLVRLGLIHYQFEAIHPFVDGNGRVGRLLVTLLLVLWELLPEPLLNLSAFFERNRDAYYDRLLRVSRDGAWRDWLLFFLAGVTEQARDAADRARRLQEVRSQWQEALRREHDSPMTLALVDHLFEAIVLTATGVRDRFSVSHPTAMRSLRRLRDLGMVMERPGRGRSRLFVAEAILRVLE